MEKKPPLYSRLEDINREGQELAEGRGITDETINKLSDENREKLLIGLSVLGEMSHPRSEDLMSENPEPSAKRAEWLQGWEKTIDAIQAEAA